LIHGADLETATGKGLFWEEYAQVLLGGRVVSLDTMNQDCDLVLDDGRRIDVKSNNLYRRKTRRGKPVDDPQRQRGWWVFNRHSDKPIDAFFCIGLVDNTPVAHYLIPTSDFPKSGATISPTSKKYSAYIVNPKFSA
jgi:hypothetical protein